MESIEEAIRAHSRQLQDILKRWKAGKHLNDADLHFLSREPSQSTVCDSIKAAAAQLGVPARLLRRAKDAGAPGFRGSRVDVAQLNPWLLVWLYEQHPLSESDRKAQAIQDEVLRKKKKFNDVQDALYIHKGVGEEVTAAFVREIVKLLDAQPATYAPDLARCGGDIAAIEKKWTALNEQLKMTLHSNPWPRTATANPVTKTTSTSKPLRAPR
jgi:hypothetical protein